MATGAAIATVVGTGVQMYAQNEQSKAQARQARANADAKRQQALELLDRMETNASATLVEGELLKGKQKTGFAGRGIEAGSGSALSTIEETNSLVARQILLDRKEANFKARQLERGASADMTLASDIRTAGKLGMAATFLSGAGRTAGYVA